MHLASVKSNMRISAGKVGKDMGRCKVPVRAKLISQLTDVPALTSPCTVPFPLHWFWFSFSRWMSRANPLKDSSCLWDKEDIFAILLMQIEAYRAPLLSLSEVTGMQWPNEHGQTQHWKEEQHHLSIDRVQLCHAPFLFFSTLGRQPQK